MGMKEMTEEDRENLNFDELNVDVNRVDNYNQIEQTSDRTLQGLYYYLQIPDELIKLQDKLRDLRRENNGLVNSRNQKKG